VITTSFSVARCGAGAALPHQGTLIAVQEGRRQDILTKCTALGNSEAFPATNKIERKEKNEYAYMLKGRSLVKADIS